MIKPGDAVSNLTVRDVMQRDVLAVDEDWPVEKLTGFLVSNNISGAPVTAGSGELIGVVSLTDIVRHDNMPNESAASRDPHEYYRYSLEYKIGREEVAMYHVEHESSVRVRDIMTPMIYSVGESTRIQEVADTMIKGRIHRVFVTSGQRLTGIVTALDMLQVVRAL